MPVLQYTGQTAQPTGGVPSLTASQIVGIYENWLGRDPDANELATDQQSALKYSAQGVEIQIANRSNNAPGSGQLGTVGLQDGNTIPAAVAGNVLSVGPAALVSAPAPVGPTGTIYTTQGAPIYSAGVGVPAVAAASSIGGLSMTTLLLIGGVAIAAFLLLRK